MITSDKELLERISGKEEPAFKELYERYSRPILRQISSRIGDADAIEDVCQDFWMFVWSSHHIIRTDENGDAAKSLYFILSKKILDYFRNTARNIISCNENVENYISPDIEYNHVFEDLVEKELTDLLARLINELPELDQRIYQLRIKGNYSIADTAAKLAISEKTVRNRMTGITSKIRTELSIINLIISSSVIYEFIQNINKHL